MQALTQIGSIVLAVVIMLVMVTIHEFGHYLAGKILGFGIREFSVGFGPALLQRKQKKTGETFSLRVIPLGGYCAFEGEDALEEERLERAEQAQTTTDPEKAPFAEYTAEPVEAETTRPSESTLTDEQKKARYFSNQPVWKRIIVLAAGATMNYLLAMVLALVLFVCYGQPAFTLRGVMADENYTAEQSFQNGDTILQANDQDLYLVTDLASALDGKRKGESVWFTVLRDGKRERVSVTLRADCNYQNASSVSFLWKALGADVETKEDGKYYMVSATRTPLSFGQSVGHAFVYTGKVALSIFEVLGELLTGKLGIDAMGGPVTTMKVTAEVATRGFDSFLEISTYIGANLAVFNLLPIPALDGSKIVFCLIEAIFKKPVPRKIEAIIHAVGMLFVFGFAILVDVLQFV